MQGPIAAVDRWRRERRRGSWPTLTVLTPTFNRAAFLPETIESVLSQGYPNLEYIVLDDGSTDDTPRVVGRYEGQLTFVQQANVGESRTVNRGLRMARGEYVMIVNSDDPLRPHCLRRMVAELDAAPDALAAYPDWVIIGEDSRRIETIRVPQFDMARMLLTTSVPIGPGACFRSSVFDVVGTRNPQLSYASDLDLWYRIVRAGPVIHVPQVLATHRVHATSASVAGRGNRLADEIVYLYAASAAHPLTDISVRRRNRQIMAYAHLSAAFACTDSRSCTRHLVRAVLADPTTAISALSGGLLKSAISLLGQLEATRGDNSRRTSEDTNRDAFNTAMRALASAPTRRSAARPMIRAAMLDAQALLESLEDHGSKRVVARIRNLPQ